MLPESICIITPNNFYHLAGSEKINLFLLGEFRKRYDHVHLVGTKLISGYFREKKHFFPQDAFRETGKVFPGINRLKTTLKRINSQRKIDAVVSVGLITSNPELYRYIQEILRIPLIIHPIGGDYQIRSGTEYGITPGSKSYWNAKRIMELADTIVVPGRFMIDEIGRDYSIPEDKFTLILNPVDIPFYALNVRFSYPGSYFIYIGRLIEKKGVDILIRAFAGARKEGLDAHLFIVGKGSEDSHLKAMTAELGVEEEVKFFGEQTGLIKLGLLKGALSFVAPSRREPYGNTIIEAISSGLPVIASGNEGHLDIPVEHYGGRYFNTVEDLKNILLETGHCSFRKKDPICSFPWDGDLVAGVWTELLNRLCMERKNQ